MFGDQHDEVILLEQRIGIDDSDKVRVYSAARSTAPLVLVPFAFLFFGTAAATFFIGHATGATGALTVIIPAVVQVFLGLAAIVLSIWSRLVRYELSSEKLVLSCGPVRYTVPLSEIGKVTKQDLQMTIRGSTRFPGFALGTVLYGGIGNVVMCSTRSSKGITVIEASSKKYGVTPADEEAFLADLMGRLGAV